MPRFQALVASTGALSASLKEAAASAGSIGTSLEAARQTAATVLPEIEGQVTASGEKMQATMTVAAEAMRGSVAAVIDGVQQDIAVGVGAAAMEAERRVMAVTDNLTARTTEAVNGVIGSIELALAAADQGASELLANVLGKTAEMLTKTDEATAEWRERTRSTVGITMGEVIANLKTVGGDVEQAVGRMMEGVRAGVLSVEDLRAAVRVLGADAVAVLNSLPLDELKKDFQGLLEFAKDANTSAEDLAAVIESQLATVNKNLADIFAKAKEEGVDALAVIKKALQDLASEVDTAGLEDLLDEYAKKQRQR